MTMIVDKVSGNDFDVQRDTTDVLPTDPIVKAWLTFKASKALADNAPGVLQKMITSTPVANVGQITQDGSVGNGDGTASFFFQITAAESTALGHLLRYFYDVQVKTTSGKIYTPVPDLGGTIRLLPRVTLATT